MIRLIVGLGNSGTKYEQTRHNAGFVFLRAAARRLSVELKAHSKFHGAVGNTRWQARKLWLLEPDTFMNLSGVAVAALANYYRIEASEVLVIHDELDLPPGTARLKKGGGAGGHNGVASVIDHLGARDFLRLRIGVGHPGSADQVVAYVLSKAPLDEFQATADATQRALDVLPDLLDGDVQRAMQRLHTGLADSVH
ncbi:MAG: aminoacyl-tRNA hydrolase [Pseudomonadota bacterium]|nr:aminoacyl-tRNA hydrolase [Pseudomonadota bacterium]